MRFFWKKKHALQFNHPNHLVLFMRILFHALFAGINGGETDLVGGKTIHAHCNFPLV
jgi:hypothetical protein